MTEDNWLLAVDIKSEATEPVRDWITAKVSRLMLESEVTDQIRGPLVCPMCGGIDAPNNWHQTPDGTKFSSIASHVIEFHRDDVPQSDIQKLISLMGVQSERVH